MKKGIDFWKSIVYISINLLREDDDMIYYDLYVMYGSKWIPECSCDESELGDYIAELSLEYGDENVKFVRMEV